MASSPIKKALKVKASLSGMLDQNDCEGLATLLRAHKHESETMVGRTVAHLAILLTASVCAAVSIGRADTSDPMGAVRQYIDAFNKGDKDAMAATCAPTSSILDGMAPHVWQGPTTCQDRYRDVLAEGEQHGASGYFVTLGTPRHVNISGDNAYVVVPASMTFKG